MTQFPAPPLPAAPVPTRSPMAPKKTSKVLIVVLVIAGLAVVGSLMPERDTSNPTTSVPATAPASDPVEYEITAEDVVDVMSPASLSKFCRAYFALGDYDVAFAQFESGYGAYQDPPAEEVFDEALSRC